jgi:5'-nucleotidase
MKNMERTVLVDMDGVLAGFDAKVIEILGRDYPHIPIPQTRKSFYISDDMAPEFEPIVHDITSKPGFFKELSVLPGALDGWEDLLANDYQPQICTAPLRKNPTSVPDKLSWLEEHFVPRFGKYVLDTAIIDKQKFKYYGIALIDDRPVIEGTAEASWSHILFTQPYNLQTEAEFRISGWGDPMLYGALGKIAQLAA